ncbi:unnamed protein product [Urochloa decumbens]|uniref:Uncharacterized protein n=1 Tax=Urochloa decumbens TaxID=240449 RepID=A0ABC9CQ14_9POAL
MAAAAARPTPSASVPAPRVAAAVLLLLLLVLASTPCGGGARPLREGVGSDGSATSRADVDHWAAHRVATVGGGAPTPPSGPSKNHN